MKNIFKINESINDLTFNNEEIFYEIIKRLIILINENLPGKVTSSREFLEILILADTMKKRLKKD